MNHNHQEHTMRSICSTLAILLALAGTGLVFAEVRTWTLAESGKTVQAEYVDTDEDAVILLIKGKEKRIKLSKLSEEDQEYVKGLAEGGRHSVNKNFTDRWPGSTIMEDKLRAKMVRENEDTGEFIYETTHFRFISPAQLSLQTVSEMGRVFEGTYTACRSIPLNFPCRRFNANKEIEEGESGEDAEEQEKMMARLFLTRADYEKAVGPGHSGSAGVFKGTEILVPFESLGIVKKGRSYAKAPGKKLDTDTLIHELTHQMSLLGVTYDVPIWFAEGMAEYVRLATYKNGRFSFKGVKKNIIPYIVGGPGTTGRQLGRKIDAPRLEQVLNQSIREFQSAQGEQIQFNYGFSTLVAYYFIHLDGKGDAARLKRWMRDLQETSKATANLSVRIPADASPEEIAAAREKLNRQAMTMKEDYHYDKLLDGRSWEDIEEEFSKKIKKALGIEVSFGSGGDSF